MDLISRQFSESVAFVQHGKAIGEWAVKLQHAFAAYQIPDPLQNTGLRISLENERLTVEILGKKLHAVTGYVLHQQRLVGRIAFHTFVDDKPFGDSFANLLVDDLGNAAIYRGNENYMWHGLMPEQGSEHLYRAACIALVDAAGATLDQV